MKRKTFIQHSSVILAGGLLSPYWSCTPRKPNHEIPSSARTNWAGNYSYKAPHLHEPMNVQEVQRLVQTLPKQKALGSRHCFNNIADSPQHQVSLKKLKEVKLDKENKTITVQAGARYGDFCESLHQQGFALHNLASLPHITVAGACATATHGSGVKNGNLATAVKQV
ncbi:MAG: FAD-binding protein, partial [Cyclobacteriaceae bacterium]